jgi:AmmeMemoRadiSam system protein B
VNARYTSRLLTAVLLLCASAAGASFAETDFLTPFTGGLAPLSIAPSGIAPFRGAAGETGTGEIFGENSIRAGIVSHHGLASEMIARFYNALPFNVERVILIGPDHFRAGWGTAAISPLSWKIGSVVVENDDEAVEILKKTRGVEAWSLPFRTEHSIGLHIAFISRWFPGAKVLSMMVRNDRDPRALAPLVSILSGLMRREKTVMILSMDFSHGKMPDNANREDEKTLGAILNFDVKSLPDRDIDASRALRLFLDTLKSLGFTDGTILERTNSSAVAGRPDLPCTSYATIVFKSEY